MKRSLYLLSLIILLVGLTACNETMAEVYDYFPDVNLPNRLIEEAKDNIDGTFYWGLGIDKVFVDYQVGSRTTGYVVLHNGNDYERLVKLSVKSTIQPEYSKTLKITYEATPQGIENWVTLGEKEFRLAKMETRVVYVSLCIPPKTEIKDKYWKFYVNADGEIINSVTHGLKLVTDDDISWKHKLSTDLLSNKLSSVKSITSSIGEELVPVSYNPFTRLLSIDGLQPNTVRDISLTYEYGEMVHTAYNQIWFVTMQ
jgi:hypothetical protein